MEIVGRTVWDRIQGALVVFIVLFLFQYYRNTVDWVSLLTMAIIFFVIMIPFDAIRMQFEE